MVLNQLCHLDAICKLLKGFWGETHQDGHCHPFTMDRWHLHTKAMCVHSFSAFTLLRSWRETSQMNSTKSSIIHKEPQSHPRLSGLGIEWWLVWSSEKRNDVFLVLQALLHSTLVANSKFYSEGVKKTGCNNNNKKNNLVQMDPKV